MLGFNHLGIWLAWPLFTFDSFPTLAITLETIVQTGVVTHVHPPLLHTLTQAGIVAPAGGTVNTLSGLNEKRKRKNKIDGFLFPGTNLAGGWLCKYKKLQFNFFLLTYWAVAVQHKSTDDDLFDKDEGLEFICSAYLHNKYPGVGVSPVDRPRCKVRYCW